MAFERKLGQEKMGLFNLIDWLTMGKVGHDDDGIVFRKVGLVPQKILVDEPSGSITYVGFSMPGVLTSEAKFRIMRVSISGSATSIEFADGNTLFDNIWDNRASLSYS